MASVLMNLPGVDVTDPEIQALLQNLKKGDDTEKDKKDKDENK